MKRRTQEFSIALVWIARLIFHLSQNILMNWQTRQLVANIANLVGQSQ
jgi:hypothetical protein